jgi:EpsI family protein
LIWRGLEQQELALELIRLKPFSAKHGVSTVFRNISKPPMNIVTRLAIVCFLIIGAQLAVTTIHGGMDPEPSPVPSIGPSTLPMTIGDFQGRDEPIDQRVFAATSADAMLNRVYRNQLGDSVFVNVGAWTEYKRGIPHRPELCYSTAGWEVVSRRLIKVPISTGKPLEIKQFVFQRENSQIAVVFWVHVGDDCITESEGIRQLRQRLRATGGRLPPLIKVMLHTDARDLTQAEARLSRLVAAIAPYTDKIR